MYARQIILPQVDDVIAQESSFVEAGEALRTPTRRLPSACFAAGASKRVAGC